MNDRASAILDALSTVARLRHQANAADPGLQQRVLALKDYQARRFARSYADLLQSPRHGPATAFFLHELYGAQDFSARDAQFVKVVPALVRLFPTEVIVTVEQLVKLHALTEQLDTSLAGKLPNGAAICRENYVLAWNACAQPEARQQQLDLTLAVGRSLDSLTRRRTLRRALQLMRRPAELAGLSALQRFLECGFDAFAQMQGADEFLATVAQRESSLANALWQSANSDAAALAGCRDLQPLL